MNPPQAPQSEFDFQEFIAKGLSEENLAARKEFLLQGAKDVRHVAGTVLEWYQELEPGKFTLWYRELESKELMQWYYVFLAWLMSPQAVTLGMTWLSTFFIVYIIVAHRLGFGPRGIISGSIAAAWQSYAYGAFTPLGSAFAFLASMAMLRKLQSVAAASGAVIATIVTAVCAFVNAGTP